MIKYEFKNIKSNNLNYNSLAILMNIVMLIQYITSLVPFVRSMSQTKAAKIQTVNHDTKNTCNSIVAFRGKILINVKKFCRPDIYYKSKCQIIYCLIQKSF